LWLWEEEVPRVFPAAQLPATTLMLKPVVA
jgi:hypothetical protein